ncbi:type II secretion system protein [Pseudoalteromonas ruthenica]|uniref:type II secretion system protein n=1 Tax=Pseudoalteromonas ruthenica TaxID=151081 RepID=UPI00110A3B05|nr:prepilin-type N-terminal cleavage/methylation domain-containing protein [Pseudoalteromonas ruthenica]TMO46485.1 hypothetical protein CWC24_10315 [Pseudoalteromonas ruthenica]TMO50344.1 hypothetical protein CWC23_11470 [Pseudoalteromonas ruthenica]
MSIGAFKKSRLGFTLVEVLVAMVIFTMVIALSVTSYRFVLGQIDDNQNRSDVSQLSKIKMLNQQVRALEPLFFINNKGEGVPFFVGQKDGFAFISPTPKLLDEHMVIAQILASEQGFIYCELPYGSQSLQNYVLRERLCQQQVMLYQGDNAELEYFGWRDALQLDNYYSEYLNVSVRPEPAWSSRYLSSSRGVLPLFIRLTLTPDAAQEPMTWMLQLPEVNPFQRGVSNASQG